jgi:hypothetical protein
MGFWNALWDGNTIGDAIDYGKQYVKHRFSWYYLLLTGECIRGEEMVLKK